MRAAKYIGAVGVAIAAALLFVTNAMALEMPPAPPLERPIVDTTHTLTDQQVTQLSEQINTARQKKSFQLAVLMVPSLEGGAIEEYTLRVTRTWGIGEKGKNNGVLLFIAKNDRKMRIEVGYGQEGALTDARAARIIRNVIAPEFRENNFYEGIQAGVTEIIAALEGQAEPAATEKTGMGDYIGALFFVGYILLSLASWIVSILARSKSWWAGGVLGAVIGGAIFAILGFALSGLMVLIAATGIGLLLDYFVSKNYRERSAKGDYPSWWAGGTFGGWGGGDSGGSFGGGDFGGGGASGDW